jgi:hypothetical protein
VDTFQFNSDGPAVMVLIKRRRARPSDTDRAAPDESRGGPINYLDADWGDLVPVVAGSACLGERPNKTGSGLLASVALLRGTIERSAPS